MRRREYLASAGAAGVAALLAGCSGSGGGDTDTPTATGTDADGGSTDTPTDTPAGTTTGGGGPETLVVATYAPFIDAPSTSPGAWIKSAFESEFDARLVWQTPDSEINYFIERKLQGVSAEADVYVGLNVDQLIRIDEKLDEALFAEAGDLAGLSDVKTDLQFDPQGRSVPYDTSYVSLVYNENEATAPETFDGLLDPEFEGDLLAQNPTATQTGRAFLLHTVANRGEDGYLDYWSRLQDNGVRILGSWSDSYSAYLGGEAPMVVSYSTDQVYAARDDQPLSEHQIRFLDDEGYANPEGMARFADASAPDLATRFLEFMLRPEVQGQIAQRNVAFPATTTAELPDEFSQYAKAPPKPVTFTYDELQGNVGEWVDAWARQFASK
jgi:thiamine transport system substrate-binding protein